MSRKFKQADYETTENTPIRLGEALPTNHLARFVVDVVAQLDLDPIYRQYKAVGGVAIAPSVLLSLLFYGYATGRFSSRKIEKATYEDLCYRYVAGGLHPDHDTIAHFRKTFLPELQGLFVEILLLAKLVGILKVGNLSLDGSKIHADASKSKAVSYGRLVELEKQLQNEVKQLFELGEQADQSEITLPEGLIIEDEIAFRKARLENLATAKAVLEARAKERYEQETAEYEVKVKEREEKANKSGKKPRGKSPEPPKAGPNEKDQYNFTDPDSRIMKNSTNNGYDQHYNAQVATTQDTMLIVATSLSNHPNDKREAEPTLDALSPKLGQPEGAALDNGFFSEHNIQALEQRKIEPYIATGREPHYKTVDTLLGTMPAEPLADASPKEKMAYKLATEIGKEIYRLRKCTVEPVIGIIKEALGFRQFSLRGLKNVSGEWCLVCLAFNLKRMHTLFLEHSLY
jgi:transposase